MLWTASVTLRIQVLRQRFALSVFALSLFASPLPAQLPFFTDDPAVIKRGTWHFEFFNETDALHDAQFPNLRQNTANYKLNYGLPYNLEIDIDSPYLWIFRALGSVPRTSIGVGDTYLGMKWNCRKETVSSRVPAMSVTFYAEFPTEDPHQELGSGESDFWLNFIAQKHLSGKNRLTVNAGIVFAGDASTGELGIHTVRGRVYTGGLSLLRDFNAKWCRFSAYNTVMPKVTSRMPQFMPDSSVRDSYPIVTFISILIMQML